MPSLISSTDIHDIALGAAVLGTGGGGDPWLGELMATKVLEERGPVTVLSADEIPDDALTVPVGGMGAPTVAIEKLPSADDVCFALHTLEERLGKEAYAVCPFEAGGLNSLYPVVVASMLNKPLLDVDGMGRAFPELQMVTFSLGGISVTPLVLADERHNAVVIEAVSSPWAERLARAATVAMGGHAMLAGYPMSGQDIRRVAIRGTLALAQRIGQAVRNAEHGERDAVQRVLDVTNGRLLFRGKITDVERRTTGGFARGQVTLDGFEECVGSQLTIQFQNEHLLAKRGGDVVASVPDLIVVLDAATAQPITTESLKYGFRTIIIGIPCDSRWRSPEGLALCGPRAFGYDVDYVPVEKRPAHMIRAIPA
ncbi:MAG: DUF917 domain-containing protein [Chloroflexota bacterium]